MMNVLTDILCDTSSIMTPQGFKETLSQDEMSHHDISSKQGQLHLLDSVSQISSIDRPLSVINHSSPSNINIFNASSQIHIPSNSTYEERNNASAFSDSFPEIVPSWLAHDFMKVSDTLPSPGILSNVSDIYSTNRDNEHLEMLDLGFPPEITSQGVPNNLNQSCINENQKLLAELPVRRFTNGDSLIIPSFTDLSNTHLQLSMNKNMSYQKFNKNGSDMDSEPSLMNTVLPCGNELLQLPLPSSLTEQCLNSSSSPSVMSNSQSQSHSVDVVCDKLPQINLNHLDSLLGNETPLSDIQLLRHGFSTVPLRETGCNSHSNRICLDSYNPNGNLVSCTGNTLASHIPPLPNLQDASVQVSIHSLSENIASIKGNCYSCNEIGPELPIEVIQCFKCHFCDFISIHKCEVASHINALHSKTSAPSISENALINIRSDNYNPVSVEAQNQAHFSTTDSITPTSVTPIINANVNNIISERNSVENQKYPCMQCTARFSNFNDYNMHLFNHNHSIKSKQFQLNLAQNKIDTYQLIPVNYVVVNPSSKNNVVNNISKLLQNDPKNSKKKILHKKTDEMPKKHHSKNSNGKLTETNVEKTISSHKKAWQKKMKRELGSYICEFKGCNVRFRALDNLEFHRKCHTSFESTFVCPECEAKFENWGALAGHLWRNHGNDMELHACDQCPFRTYRLSRLENYHKRIHRDECLFLCDTCGKSFKNGKQLRNHRVTHSKDSQRKKSTLKCNICSKSMSSKKQLSLHHRTVHNKIKPHRCKYCDYSASKRSTLNMHVRQHTGEKPFMCDKCQFRTSDHNSLRRHKMTHSGEKPYKCPHCTYSCIQAESFKEHLKKHKDILNEGLVFSCNICSFRTLKQDNYISHMVEHDIQNRPQGENSMTEIHSTDEIFPLAEAMDKSLSNGDHLLSNFNKNKYMQSYFNGLNMNNGLNMVTDCVITADGWVVSG